MKILATGIRGQLGRDMMNELTLRRIEGIGMDVEETDITDRTACETVTSQRKPNTVIHCVTYTTVDTTEDNLELRRRINAEGTCNIARVCKAMDIKTMCTNMDCVFSDDGQQLWEPDDHKEPLNIYGLTKYKGEITVGRNTQRYFIVCIAWVFSANGKDFIRTMLRLGKEKGAVSVVNDQVSSPTYTYDLTRLSVDMIQTDRYGCYHATNEGLYNWYEFTYKISRQAGVDGVRVTPTGSDGFPTKAKRSSSSHINKEKLTEGGPERLPSWQDALGRYLKVLKENKMA